MVRYGIQLDSDAISRFCARWRICSLSVFGSVLRADFRSDSDIDFVADFGVDAPWDLIDLEEMKDELAGIVGRKVDLLSRYAVERSQNPYRKQHILSTEERVYAA
jgi:predicted nucleotidyltransferase